MAIIMYTCTVCIIHLLKHRPAKQSLHLTKTLCIFLTQTIHVTHPTHSTLLDQTILITTVSETVKTN
jgi:hypothetical protein